MSVRAIETEYRLMEAKGLIPEGQVGRLTLATIFEAGMQAFHRGYYGDGVWAEEALSARRARHEGDQAVMGIQEALVSDIRSVTRVTEAHTTTDFPIVLANLRDRVLRKTFTPFESAISQIATERDVSDFKLINGYRIGELDRLTLRPEGTDVEMTTIGTTTDGYRVANYEKGIAYTWEAYINDDLSIFTNALAALGRAARRNRNLVIFEAINTGLASPTQYTAAAGPDVTRLEAAILDIAGQVADDSTTVIGFAASDIIIPSRWQLMAKKSLESELLQGTTANAAQTNVIKGMLNIHVEKLMSRILGDDWLIYDSESPWLEIAYLNGFKPGPKSYAKVPDVGENLDEGSFRNHTFEVKVGDALAAKVIETKNVRRVDGS